jgi:hypothetical protein
VTDIGFWNPFMIRLYGIDHAENACTVLVHMSALSLVLKTVKKLPEKERVRIGFRAEEPGPTGDSAATH